MPPLPNLRNKYPSRTKLSMNVGYDEIIYPRGHFCPPHQYFLLTSAFFDEIRELSILTKSDINREQI